MAFRFIIISTAKGRSVRNTKPKPQTNTIMQRFFCFLHLREINFYFRSAKNETKINFVLVLIFLFAIPATANIYQIHPPNYQGLSMGVQEGGVYLNTCYFKLGLAA